MIEELRWFVGLNIVLAFWMGLLADSWKGRRIGVWMAIGMVTSLGGLILLICMPKLPRPTQELHRQNRFAPKDSYGH